MTLAWKHTLIPSRLLSYTNCMHWDPASKFPATDLTLQAWERWKNFPGSAAPGHTSQLEAEESSVSKLLNLWAINKTQSAELKRCGLQFQPSPGWKAPPAGKKQSESWLP